MKKVWLIGFSLCLLCLGLTNVKAENITYQRISNTYYNLTVDGKTISNHVTKFFLDGRLAYCIEPGKDINTSVYDSYTDWSKTSLDLETRQYIEKIGYYGYEYPGHQTDKYYIATQELIWRAIKDVDIKWTTAKNGSGQVIDIEQEKNNILDLVQRHSITPSFTNEVITGVVGETKEIEDKNQVLSNYEISSSTKHDIQVQDNKLIITFNNNPEEETISLTRKNYDTKTLLVYVKGDSQQLASLRISTPETLSFKVKSVEVPEDTPEEEIVKVPSTGDQKTVKHFGVTKFLIYDGTRFN